MSQAGNDEPMTNGFHTTPDSTPDPSPAPPREVANRDRDSREASRMVGTVKWFNAKVGYGFITRNDTGEDVFVHFTGITRKNPRHSIKSLGDGETVEFNIMATNVSGIDGRPVRGNPYVSHIPIRRNDSYASGDPITMPPSIRRFMPNSRIPRWIANWQPLI